MKKLILILLFCSSFAFSYDYQGAWNAGQADTIKKGRFEVGIFQPLKYGLTNDIELQTQPLLDFILPNILLKKSYLKGKTWTLSSEHYMSYPTLALKLISKRGIGGLLPETAKNNIPQQIYTDHAILFTYKPSKYFKITPKITLSLPIIFNNSGNKFPTIDLFLLYNRTASFHGDFLYTLSVDVDGFIFYKLYYTIDFDYYNELPINPYDSEGIGSVYEHKFMLIWKNSSTFSIYAGYKLIHANYPYGAKTTLLPLLDFAWGF